MTDTKTGMPSFTEEQIRGWIKEEEDVIRELIVDEMKRFFNLATKAQMDQQIKVIEACGFKVIPEEVKDKETNAESAQDTIDKIKASSYIEPDYYGPPYG
jgi:hypothetical protein